MTASDGLSFSWHFGKKLPSEVERNPIPSEFFVSESRHLADNLVRESIQNALDARLGQGRDRESAWVRFYLSEAQGALPKAKADRWFHGLDPHLLSQTSGLKSPPCGPGSWDECPFLVCEDFGTHGLLGDPSQSESTASDVASDFYNFFRAEALSSKGGGKGGTWGVGKTVFPMASRANAFIGQTVQEGNSRRLLMGRCILRYHKVSGGGPMYRSDGFFGSAPDQDGALVMPLHDMPHVEALNEFAADFVLQRRPGDPGLSVVVPWYRTGNGGSLGLSIESLRQAVLEHFFWAIVTSALTVTLASPNGEETIALDTIDEALARLRPDVRARLGPFVALAKWADGQRAAGAVPDLESVCREWSAGPPDWRECLREDDVKPLAERLESEKRVALRVPVTLIGRRPQQHELPSHFDIFLEEADEALRPAFHRDLLLICEEPRKPQTVQGFRALVVADDFNLAHFLGAAEVPSHDHWEPNQQELPVDYAYSSQMLKFVRYSIKNIGTCILDSRPSEVDHTLTMDFFPRADASGGEGDKRKPGDDEGKDVNRPPRDLKPGARLLTISGSAGTVGIRLNTTDSSSSMQVGRWLNVKLAYNIRRGSPLKNWQPDDFRLDGDAMAVKADGLSELRRTANRLWAKIDREDFTLKVAGFDAARDVYVKATVDDEGGAP